MRKNEKNVLKEGENQDFSFLAEANLLMDELSDRSKNIMRGRYGMLGSGSRTLEEIGLANNITRERVRQITREVQKKISHKIENSDNTRAVKEIMLAIEKTSGIIRKERLIQILGKGRTKEEGAVLFFLDCMKAVELLEIKGEISESYCSSDFDLENWKMIKEEAIAFLKEKKVSLDDDFFYDEISKKTENKNISKKSFFDYLDVSVEIKKSSFGKWGLAEWKEISPKGTREKAYLILKEYGKPMHFRDIAKSMDKHGLTRKKAHPQTVHNELIKGGKFVLVGRGIYALCEWGYNKGTVKEVLERILSEKKRAMSKEELIKEVLKVRQVKISTITINLNNFFRKTDTGIYEITSKK